MASGAVRAQRIRKSTPRASVQQSLEPLMSQDPSLWRTARVRSDAPSDAASDSDSVKAIDMKASPAATFDRISFCCAGVPKLAIRGPRITPARP
jgi:hypothetical protein